jgi:hypothetical protein
VVTCLGSRFQSRPRLRLSWPSIFFIFLSRIQILGVPGLGHDSLLPNPFIHSSYRSGIDYWQWRKITQRIPSTDFIKIFYMGGLHLIWHFVIPILKLAQWDPKNAIGNIMYYIMQYALTVLYQLTAKRETLRTKQLVTKKKKNWKYIVRFSCFIVIFFIKRQ